MAVPLILLTNDDGVSALGLEMARRALEGLGRVVVVAPAEERSGASHSLSLTQPVRIEHIASDRYATTGTPVDCVILGFRKILGRFPDLVVSGINHGANLGEDVLYSGTVAAAREAALHEVPSFAVSALGKQEEDFEHASRILRHLIKSLWARVGKGTFLNINVPEGQPGEYRFTRQGSRRITSGIAEKTDLRGRTYYWIGPDQSQWMVTPDSDYEAVLGGLTSVTPMQLIQTDYTMLASLKELDLDAVDLLEPSP